MLDTSFPVSSQTAGCLHPVCNFAAHLKVAVKCCFGPIVMTHKIITLGYNALHGVGRNWAFQIAVSRAFDGPHCRKRPDACLHGMNLLALGLDNGLQAGPRDNPFAYAIRSVKPAHARSAERSLIGLSVQTGAIIARPVGWFCARSCRWFVTAAAL